MVAAACASLLALEHRAARAELPPLTEAQAAELATARDDRDSAFVALVENAQQWSPPFDDVSLRYEPALEPFLADPAGHRGELCLLRGVIQQQWIPPDPVQGVVEWSLRSDDGRPFLVYVVGTKSDAGEVQLPAVADGTEVTIIARFYKRVQSRSQGGEQLRYAAFVGAWPRAVKRPAMISGRGGLVVAGPVLLLFMVFLGLLWYVRRQKRDASPQPGRAREHAHASINDDDAAAASLPSDPADAMVELHRRAAES